MTTVITVLVEFGGYQSSAEPLCLFLTVHSDSMMARGFSSPGQKAKSSMKLGNPYFLALYYTRVKSLLKILSFLNYIFMCVSEAAAC